MRHKAYSALVCLVLLATGPIAMGESPCSGLVRVLLLSGQNNHNWQMTTPKLKAILEDTKRFSVEVTEHPEQLTSESLNKFQAIVSNWNAHSTHSTGESNWPPIAKEAYMEFVRRGGGHVVVHAGSASFPQWEEYHEMTLATWKVGQTRHDKQHTFTVDFADDTHLITQGLQSFEYYGELWLQPSIQEGTTVLATASSPLTPGGHNAPVAFASNFGKGRSFTLLLGHDANEMDNQGFQSLLTRGVYWAAIGEAMPSQATPEQQ
ncbi:ThuA domain-containing protein [Aeoliella mucimassa]|uniref:Trehalose utilization n=1 Tax=Aeoliella mucimassa TaxID=2527972 RepID=A0A518APL2_9BACT|nr:ThuA domain-containing protein [Aeoliella mucimassa]QDU56665.1 Trehalose utilization [Aeoliella mucimassa]